MTCKSAAGRIGLVQMAAYRGAVHTEQQLSDRGLLKGLCHRNIKKIIQASKSSKPERFSDLFLKFPEILLSK